MHPNGVPESRMVSTYLCLDVHIVFSTKGRAALIEKAWQSDLHAYIGGTVRGLGAVPISIGGTADHIHLLIGIKAVHSVAELVREIKKATSAWASQRSVNFGWQVGYGAFSVSPGDINRVRIYIENQEAHHRGVTSENEMRGLLIESGIEIDERFFE